MTYVPIERVEIENYGCIKKASFKLSPLHALIGPNDSGKSTVLRALRTAAQFAAGRFDHDQNGARIPFDPMFGENEKSSLIRLHYADGKAYAIHTQQDDEAMSERLLHHLGFTTLKYTQGPDLFLVENPEKGLHPARIAEMMTDLRESSKTSQVVIATHSPLVVNELQGHEVTVVTRPPEEGTQAVLLKDVPGFDDATKVYQPGEFWVSYCDGEQETPLLTGSIRT